ncbi:hypothetical protein ABZW30_08115 [Kitasatospora sp. NPDC004669]|uniref:hypothetical protein n=1 Tax=Kitasatospora sp. NPDC004669 TaxID=3154555 RepID=UPI0033B0958C
MTTLPLPTSAVDPTDPWAAFATAATDPADLAQSISGDAEQLADLANVLDNAPENGTEPARQLSSDVLSTLVALAVTCANSAAAADLSNPPTREAFSALRSLESAACGVLSAAGVLTTGLEQALPDGAPVTDAAQELRARAAGLIRQAHGHVRAAAAALDPQLALLDAGTTCPL